MSIKKDITEPIYSLDALRREARATKRLRQVPERDAQLAELRELDIKIAELTIALMQHTLHRLER